MPQGFVPLKNFKTMATELGGEWECWYHSLYWSISKLTHPSGLGSYTYIQEHDEEAELIRLNSHWPYDALPTDGGSADSARVGNIAAKSPSLYEERVSPHSRLTFAAGSNPERHTRWQFARLRALIFAKYAAAG
jgi:hypothetical protein